MNEPTSIFSRHWLVGTWRTPDPDDSSAAFTVRAKGAGFVVTGIDTNDGEVFEIFAVSWDGTRLRFTSRMPSTDWVVEHEFSAGAHDSVVHWSARREIWIRR